MRVICLEEHVVDKAIVAASQYEQHKQAAFAEYWGSRVTDEASPTSRKPQLVSPKQAQAEASNDFADRIAEMDRHGVDMQVLSYTHEMQFTPAADAPRLCAAANDKLVSAAKSHPARFGSFSTLPWTQPRVAIAELERTTGLGMQGTLLAGRPGDTFLDDPYYWPVLATLNRFKVPLYLHPGFPLLDVQKPYYGGLDNEVTARLSMFGWGWHNEAGVQVIRMILAGVFERFPDLQIISGHWGEMD